MSSDNGLVNTINAKTKSQCDMVVLEVTRDSSQGGCRRSLVSESGGHRSKRWRSISPRHTNKLAGTRLRASSQGLVWRRTPDDIGGLPSPPSTNPIGQTSEPWPATDEVVLRQIVWLDYTCLHCRMEVPTCN